MIKITAKCFIKAGKKDEFLELCKELINATRNEKECIKYELFQDTKDELLFTFIEEWKDVEALQNHIHTTHFTKIIPSIKELLEKEMESNVYNKVI